MIAARAIEDPHLITGQIPTILVDRCGPGGSMRACHEAGPGSIPGRDKFPG